MKSQYYPFTGDERQSMAFTPVLDGTVYNCQLKWNITAQRWNSRQPSAESWITIIEAYPFIEVGKK
ncbi:hypothetical protein ACQSFK_07885 [Salmonella enterica]|uniref:hypothetical protein n=1 Tax=Salmonella enterica TaxID=28901 RepID=UPI003D31A776